MSASLYRDIVGSAAWDSLPRAIHEMHERGGDGTLVVTSRGVARLLSLLGYAPSPGGAAVTLRIERTENGERWVRTFNDEVFATAQTAKRGLIAERFGPIELLFRVSARNLALRFEAAGVRLLGIALPRLLQPRMEASERVEGSRVHVSISIGKAFRYTGFITPR